MDQKLSNHVKGRFGNPVRTTIKHQNQETIGRYKVDTLPNKFGRDYPN